MTKIKVLIMGNNFYLKKNCLSRKMLYDGGTKNYHFGYFRNFTGNRNDAIFLSDFYSIHTRNLKEKSFTKHVFNVFQNFSFSLKISRKLLIFSKQ